MVTVAAVQLKAYDVQDSQVALEQALLMIDRAVEGKAQLVVLPECTFPGYFLGHKGYAEDAIMGLDEVISLFCDKAKQDKIYLIVGLPEVDEDKKIYNSAYLIGVEGEIIGIARKSLLWHFDREWFSEGDNQEVFNTSLGKIGMIVCADGRQPEISRILALKGAEIIVDVTNLVATGNDDKHLANPQTEYMLPCRAFENKVWYVVSNKIGMEAESILFAGGSCIISPEGVKVGEASSYKQEIVTADIDLTLSNDKNSDSKFNAISDRNPSLYSVLTENIATLPITEVLSEKVVPSKLSIFVSVVQMKEDITFQQYLDKVSKIVPMMALQNSQLLVFPELKCTYQEDIQERLASKMLDFAHQYSLALVFSLLLSEGDKKYKTAVFVEPTGKIFSYKKTHLSSDEIETYNCGEELPVFKTSLGKVGMMMGYEGFIPEVSRVLMLKGADLICWQANSSSNYHSFVVRTRSAENKVFLAVSDTWGKNSRGHSLICNPGGAIVARALHESNQIVSSQLELVSTRCKMVVTGTHIVNNRIPKVYNELI